LTVLFPHRTTHTYIDTRIHDTTEGRKIYICVVYVRKLTLPQQYAALDAQSLEAVHEAPDVYKHVPVPIQKRSQSVNQSYTHAHVHAMQCHRHT
jgi:hypothetical protein